MGSSNSVMCCYCWARHGHCCGKSEACSKDEGHRESGAYGRPSPYDAGSFLQFRPSHSLFPDHCDDESIHSYYQEITCFCPSKSIRKMRKKSSESNLRPDRKASSTFQDFATPSSCEHFGRRKSRRNAADECLPNRPPSSNVSVGKSNRSSLSSVILRTRARLACDGLSHNQDQNCRRDYPTCRTRCYSHRSRTHCVPPFPLHLDAGGEREGLTKNHNTYMMSTNSQADMEEWIRALRRVIRAPPGGGIFGGELNRTMRYEEQVESKLPPGNRRQREAPYIVETCCEFIRENGGFFEEGLFRLPGQANDVKELQDSFDMGERPTFEKSTDTHTVASLMKSFLRELPEPLVPYNLYPLLIEAAKIANKSNRARGGRTTAESDGENEEARKARESMKKLLHELPQENFKLLRYLCRFLDEVQQHSKHNKMDVDNLALMFGPNIMRSKAEEPMTMMSHATYVQHIMSEFIRNHKYLFPDDDPDWAPATSIPDVAADAASRDLRDAVALNVAPLAHNPSADASLPSYSAHAVSTEGFNTMTTHTTTSPPGTIGIRHTADDSGTGSLGPTPDNTSRRTVGSGLPHVVGSKHSSAIIEEGHGNETVGAEGSTNAGRVTPNKPRRTRQPSSNTDIGRRESFYDNVAQTSDYAAANSAKRRYRNQKPQIQPKPVSRIVQTAHTMDHGKNTGYSSGSGRSSYADQQSPTPSSFRSSTNAVAGSSAQSLQSYDVISCSPTMSMVDHQKNFTTDSYDVGFNGPKPPLRKKRSKKSEGVGMKRTNGRCLSDEESNTESVAAEGTHSVTGSRQGSVSSVGDAVLPKNRPHGVPHRPAARPPPPPYRPNDGTHRQPTYEELQDDVRLLQEKLHRQTGTFEARTRSIEEQLLRQIQDLRFSTSSEFAYSPLRADQSCLQGGQAAMTRKSSSQKSNFTSDCDGSLNHVEMSSMASEDRIVFDSTIHRFDLDSKDSMPPDVRSSEEQVIYLKKCVSEEKRLRQMVEIQLRNEQRARAEAEERNEQLQKEMREFFFTFGSMFSNNSESSSIQG